MYLNAFNIFESGWWDCVVLNLEFFELVAWSHHVLGDNLSFEFNRSIVCLCLVLVRSLSWLVNHLALLNELLLLHEAWAFLLQEGDLALKVADGAHQLLLVWVLFLGGFDHQGMGLLLAHFQLLLLFDERGLSRFVHWVLLLELKDLLVELLSEVNVNLLEFSDLELGIRDFCFFSWYSFLDMLGALGAGDLELWVRLLEGRELFNLGKVLALRFGHLLSKLLHGSSVWFF